MDTHTCKVTSMGLLFHVHGNSTELSKIETRSKVDDPGHFAEKPSAHKSSRCEMNKRTLGPGVLTSDL